MFYQQSEKELSSISSFKLFRRFIKKSMRQILVVDDEKNMREILKILLEDNGYTVITAENGEQAIRFIDEDMIIDLIISDLKMDGIDGIGILRHIQKSEKKIPLVLITAYGSIEAAVEAMKMGAYDFITKPFNKDVLIKIINRIFHMERLENERELLKKITEKGPLIYKSSIMKDIMNTVKKIAPVTTPVLLTGESGTGKGLIAETIHHLYEEKIGTSLPFIAINCPAIPENLLESELFGYKKGAFTGANEDFVGKVRLADKGTLFLDEIADFPLTIQAKILHLLENKTFSPLGSTKSIKINTRIICATNKNLKKMVHKGKFRKDLYYRINTITINLPPLRERKEDIVPIAEFFISKYDAELGKKITGLSQEAKRAVSEYNWPGNIRELRNVIERAVVLSNKESLELSDFPFDIQSVLATETPNESKFDSIERRLILDTLRKTNGNITASARILNVSRGKLRNKIKKYRLM